MPTLTRCSLYIHSSSVMSGASQARHEQDGVSLVLTSTLLTRAEYEG